VQACILCPFTGRLDLEAAHDVGEDLTQLEQRKRRPEAAPLAASEGHPRARVGPLRQESVGSEGVGLRVPMAMDQRGRDEHGGAGGEPLIAELYRLGDLADDVDERAIRWRR
jgi:hypothetical protein